MGSWRSSAITAREHQISELYCTVLMTIVWLGSRVVSVLDSGAEGPGFKSQSQRCRVTVLGKLRTPIVPLFTKKQKLVAALLRVGGITAGLAESNGSLPLGLWLTSPAGWQPRTGISSGTLRSAIEYGLPFYCTVFLLLVIIIFGINIKMTCAAWRT